MAAMCENKWANTEKTHLQKQNGCHKKETKQKPTSLPDYECCVTGSNSQVNLRLIHKTMKNEYVF